LAFVEGLFWILLVFGEIRLRLKRSREKELTLPLQEEVTLYFGVVDILCDLNMGRIANQCYRVLPVDVASIGKVSEEISLFEAVFIVLVEKGWLWLVLRPVCRVYCSHELEVVAREICNRLFIHR